CVGGNAQVVRAIGDPARAGETLVVIEEYPVVANVGKFVRIEEKLRGANMHTSRVFVANVKVTGEPAMLVVGGEFPAVNFTFSVVKGRKDERLPELSFIQNVAGVFVETVDAKLQTISDLLCHARIEVMGALRFYRRVERDGGFVGCASKLRDRTLVDVLQRRRSKIAGVTGVESRRGPRCVNNVDARAELTFRLDCLRNVDPATKIDGQLFK